MDIRIITSAITAILAVAGVVTAFYISISGKPRSETTQLTGSLMENFQHQGENVTKDF